MKWELAFGINVADCITPEKGELYYSCGVAVCTLLNWAWKQNKISMAELHAYNAGAPAYHLEVPFGMDCILWIIFKAAWWEGGVKRDYKTSIKN